jgi:hypothetical protein
MTVGLFHHIDLNLSDMAASRRVHGLVLGYRQVEDEADGCEWDLPPSTAPFAGASLGRKACAPSETGHLRHRYAPGLRHLAWRAETRDQADALHRLLVRATCPCSTHRPAMRNIPATARRSSPRNRTASSSNASTRPDGSSRSGDRA